MRGADFEVRFASGERTRCVIRPGALGSLEDLAAEAGLSGKGALIADERLLTTRHGPALLRYAETRLGRPIARPVGEDRKCLAEAEAMCEALADRGVAPHIYESSDEARAHLTRVEDGAVSGRPGELAATR